MYRSKNGPDYRAKNRYHRDTEEQLQNYSKLITTDIQSFLRDRDGLNWANFLYLYVLNWAFLFILFTVVTLTGELTQTISFRKVHTQNKTQLLINVFLDCICRLCQKRVEILN